MNWDEYNAEKQKEKQENYDRAMKTFDAAVELARVNGLRLSQHSPWHFSLTHIKDGWRINLYPSNQRIYADPHHLPPFLRVQKPWTFLDVASAAIIQTQLPPKKLIDALERKD